MNIRNLCYLFVAQLLRWIGTYVCMYICIDVCHNVLFMTSRCINFDEESEEFEYIPGYAAGGVPIRGTVHKGGYDCLPMHMFVCIP